ncbi:MAG: hypothetical protein LBQ66_01385, partial [Planctomycetaceae bacterium]|nr:hypothetical protein [Planctomycetaceae bacterium]
RLHGVIKIQHLRCCSAPKQTREYVYDLCGITRRDARVPVRAASRKLSATPTIGACWFCQCVSRSRCRRVRRRYSPRKLGGRLPTLRLPTRFGVQFKLFWCYYAQRRAGRPRSSPRRFAAIVGYADNWGELVLPVRVPILFWFLPFQGEGYWGRFFTGRCPVLWAFCPVGACWFCRCV